jgi:uncharacterized protein YndB with AHSA1/START domain
MTSRTLVALRVGAAPQRVFEVFTREIGQWWQPNGLFQFTRGRQGALAFEPRAGGRFTETYSDGEVFEIGTVRVWEPPARLVFTWRQAGFAPDQQTEVHVRFEAVADQTRVTVEHFGWDALPQDHVARHDFPLPVFQRRLAEWWQRLLAALSARTAQASQTHRAP